MFGVPAISLVVLSCMRRRMVIVRLQIARTLKSFKLVVSVQSIMRGDSVDTWIADSFDFALYVCNNELILAFLLP